MPPEPRRKDLLVVEDLTVEFETPGGRLRAVDRASFRVGDGEVVALVGESGSGKSVTVKALLGLLPSRVTRVTGRATFAGEDLLALSQRRLRRVRGTQIGLVFQEPHAALNPLLRVGQMLTEAIRSGPARVSSRAATERAVSLLEQVQVPAARDRLRSYPHQLSGGMAQRVGIALAMVHRPRILIADEPTTALDVTVQAEVLKVLLTAQRAAGAALVLVTHDLALAAEVADRVVVMYAGRPVEIAPTTAVFDGPQHPYTLGLLASIPRLDRPEERLLGIPGAPPDPRTALAGCPFLARCSLTRGREDCRVERPVLRAVAADRTRTAACHHSDEVGALG